MDRVMHVSWDHFRRWGASPRIYVIGGLALLMLAQWVRAPLVAFSRAVEVSIAPWFYPFLMEDWYISMMVQIGMVLLFCDAPFMNDGTAYLLIRAGKKSWFWGQILYIAQAALLFQLFLALSCALILLPNLEWTMSWGKVLNTLALTDAGYDYFTPVIRYTTIAAYTPIQATLLSFSIASMVTMIFGMLIFTVNLFLPRVWGPVIGGIVTILTSFALSFSGGTLYFFSPGSWMTLGLIHPNGYPGRPTLPYIWTAGLGLLVVLTTVSFWRYRRCSIEVLPNL